MGLQLLLIGISTGMIYALVAMGAVTQQGIGANGKVSSPTEPGCDQVSQAAATAQ